MRPSRALKLAAVLVGSAAALFACVDEVHDQEVAALGPEQPGVPPGPTHRPGQPCVTCHGGSGPAHTQFSVGGTAYEVEGQPAPAVGASVVIEDKIAPQLRQVQILVHLDGSGRISRIR